MPERSRLDRVLVARGLAPSRARAAALIRAGVVCVNGQIATRPSAAVSVAGEVEEGGAFGVVAADAVTLVGNPCPWVSRAALKLLHALDRFGLTPHGLALDIGASTGGFSEVLLARGAAHVHAVDVGRGQLHKSLADDPRITLHEGLNIRRLPKGLIPPVDWLTCDVSFLGLEKALPPALALAKPKAMLVALIKPQFEVGPAGVGKGGIVPPGPLHAQVQARIAAFLDGAGWAVAGLAESPIAGGDGNREYLIAAQARA
ncbi:MAG: TlyA family RNA methyltransferase [Pseudomonadota bacterium]